MKPWIIYPTTLTGPTVALVSLEKVHFTALESLAKDPRIWEHYPFDLSDSLRFQRIFTAALKEREKGSQFPFTIIERHSDQIVGSTRFLDIQPQHKKLEIGFTWIHPRYWGSQVNLECKWLLLTHCFEKMGCVRVQLKTDENNIRSRKAIEKIGGQFEGVLRHDMLRDDHTHRNSAYYSIIDEEWQVCKNRLMGMLAEKQH